MSLKDVLPWSWVVFFHVNLKRNSTISTLYFEAGCIFLRMSCFLSRLFDYGIVAACSMTNVFRLLCLNLYTWNSRTTHSCTTVRIYFRRVVYGAHDHIGQVL